jgi:integrase
MFATGARAGEVAAMQVNDLNLRSVPPTVIIRHGKGGKAGCERYSSTSAAAHSGASLALRGGSEGGLMAVAGWTRPDMLMRYTKAQASARAAEEAQQLKLGEL